MPATVANAVCGPQVNDTATAPPGTDLSTLNERPLNACCDVWGQCGLVYYSSGLSINYSYNILQHY